MTNWTFQVGTTASETGALTWNANGTLRQLAIVDGFNSGGSQTCTFGTSSVMGYDDIGRLLSDNCGSVWAQTFSYDLYDNLTKSGSISWNPGYNPANNHYSTGASYDNSGNLKGDSIHTYTWEQFGKLSSIDSSACGTNGECVTYDAMGRIVETSYNSVYTEIWYTQLGKAYMTGGSTPYYAYWPTPGNGTVEVNGNAVTFYYMHKDWLGSARISSTLVNHTVVSDQAYAPYGDVYNKLATGAGVPAQMFAGDTQDIISGIFDTPNRELNASQGRWLSPDPAGAGWNQYAYATNPNSFVDPSGLCPNCDYPPHSDAIDAVWKSESGACLVCIPIYVNYGQIIMGNTFVDALQGQAGTYVYTNMYNQTSFGFSEDLWGATLNMIDAVHGSAKENGMTDLPSYPTSGFQTMVHDLGNGPEISGILVDWSNAQAQAAYLTHLALPYLVRGQQIPVSLESQLTAAEAQLTTVWSQLMEIILPGFSNWNP